MFKPIQISILAIQIAAILFELYAIFIQRVQDYGWHIVSIIFFGAIMTLSIISWNQSKNAIYGDLSKFH